MLTYKTIGTCSRQILFDITEDGKVENVKFIGGCDGNTKAIAKLLEGADAEKTVEILKGNQCGMKGTSCADQLAKGIAKALEE